MPNVVGVKFVDECQTKALFEQGFCAFIISAQDRKDGWHPEIGDFVDLLIGKDTTEDRCRARLVADQNMPDGSCISIYAAAPSVFRRQR